MASYVDFASTERQKEIAKLMDEGLNGSEIGRQLGFAERNARKAVEVIKARAASKSIPEHSSQIPDGYKIKGTSTLYKDGRPALQWVKTNEDAERQAELMREVIDELKKKCPA